MKKWIGSIPALLLAGFCIAAQPVDINSASAEQLAEALTGVGKSKAELIVRYREMHGDFKHADELVNVRGIGLATVDRNRENIRIGRSAPAKPSGQ
ncbi:MAG: helix-hairpin-helix domain-containing protein [Gammaproteobacteria bacterium]